MNLELGRAIRIVRQAKDFKVSDLAERAAVSVPFVSLIESGDRQPSLQVLRRIADALGVPSEVLIVLAQPRNGTLATSGRKATRLATAIRKLVEAEDSLRTRLVKEDAGEAG